jgi:hypothetical protein
VTLPLIQDEMLLDGAKYNISEERRNRYETVMYLTIKSWQIEDESHFTCISTNSLGKADGRIQSYSELMFMELHMTLDF